jgi:hypothetical protein
MLNYARKLWRYDSYIPASKSAEALGFKHNVLKMDYGILDETCDMIDG